jgi:hypothetical protein
LDSINNSLDNLAITATNEKAVNKKLIATYSSLATSNTTLTNQVKALHDKLAAKTKGGGRRGGGSNDPDRKKGPDPAGYCWSRGCRIGQGYTSHTFSNPKDSHQPTATYVDIMGGSIANKD